MDGFRMTRREALLGMTAAGVASAFGAETAEVTVSTVEGRLQGARENGVNRFLGVPYAGPTARFMPPAPLARWNGTRPALDKGPICPQPQIGGAPPRPLGPSDEACQHVNVWTPGLGAGKRAVMFWIHGGGFQVGSGNDLDGANLARTQDVVVVAVTHRLGALGQLWLGDKDSRYAGAGAAGFLDIVAALGWVKRNIAEFGGDPDRVLIFGQSGGGGKVLTLLGMPEATPLFHRAIVQSGTMPRTAATMAEGEELASLIFRAAGVRNGDVSALSAVPIGAFTAAQKSVNDAMVKHPLFSALPSGGDLRPYSAVIDGTHVLEQPFGTRAPPYSQRIPVMIGCTTKEMRTFSRELPQFYALDASRLHTEIEKILGASTDSALQLYRRSRPQASPSDLFWAITTADMYWAQSLRIAELKARDGKAPVYMYSYDYDPDVGRSGVTARAGHGSELPSVFANLSAAEAQVPDAARVASEMSGAWTSFARDGRPTVPGVPVWPAYDLAQRATLRFGIGTQVVNDPYRSEREWWARPPAIN